MNQIREFSYCPKCRKNVYPFKPTCKNCGVQTRRHYLEIEAIECLGSSQRNNPTPGLYDAVLENQ